MPSVSCSPLSPLGNRRELTFPSPELSKLSHPVKLLLLQGMHPVGQRSVLLESAVPDTSSSAVFVTWPLPLSPDSEGTQVQDCPQEISE